MHPQPEAPDFLVIPVPPAAVAALEARGDLSASLTELAMAIASSPRWNGMRPATLIVRALPVPALAIVGRFDAMERTRIGWLSTQLEETLPRMRRASWADVEEACERLAASLLDRLGRDEIRRSRFAAIPRGGAIVLGILSYLLDLAPDQLGVGTPTGPHDGPLVIVDDTILSGYRLKRFLAQADDPRICVASLWSTPHVREAIEAEEPRIAAVLSAHDLRDHADVILGEAAQEWRERWQEREQGATYWTGMPDHLCLPWTEPDISFWNPHTEREERGWNMVAPHTCLKHRGPELLHPPSVQVQPTAPGPLKPAASVIYGSHEDRLVVGSIGSTDGAVLDTVGADMWHALVRHGCERRAVDALVDLYDAPHARLAADVDRLVSDLTARGLMERDPREDAERA